MCCTLQRCFHEGAWSQVCNRWGCARISCRPQAKLEASIGKLTADAEAHVHMEQARASAQGCFAVLDLHRLIGNADEFHSTFAAR